MAAEVSGDLALSVTGLTKVFGGTVALADGNLSVARSEIHALAGENGAGKSTLIRCLAGTPAPDDGRIVVAGQPFPEHHTPADAAAAGLAFIHQGAPLVEDLSVAENIALGIGYRMRLGAIRWRGVHRVAREALERLGVDLDTHSLVAQLPPASRMIVAIARALAGSPRVLVLDEPTANLSAGDVATLFGILRHLRDEGCGIVYVSHHLDEVEAICDRITILRDGRTVASGRVSDFSQSEIIKLLCGRDVTAAVKAPPSVRDQPILEVRDLTGPFLEPQSFEVAPGEVVGFTGLTDAGHYVLGELLFGLIRPTGGAMALDGDSYAPRNAADALARQLAYVPPDRDAQGLARELSVVENLFMNPDASRTPVERLLDLGRGRRERKEAAGLLNRFHVRPPEPDRTVSTLSGGNAQKVLVARALRRPPRVLIASDLTVGVDVNARAEVHKQIREIAGQGSAVLVITSDFEEIEALCSRAFVMQRGRLIGTLEGPDVTADQITGCAVVGAWER